MNHVKTVHNLPGSVNTIVPFRSLDLITQQWLDSINNTYNTMDWDSDHIDYSDDDEIDLDNWLQF
jgi:hypothetical protein